MTKIPKHINSKHIKSKIVLFLTQCLIFNLKIKDTTLKIMLNNTKAKKNIINNSHSNRNNNNSNNNNMLKQQKQVKVS